MSAVHELSLAQAVWEQAERVCRQHGGGRVVTLRVGVGDLSGVEPDLLRSAFDLLVETGRTGAARLELERSPLEARCESWSATFPVERFQFICPECGGPRLTVLQGEHVTLQQVTLEPAGGGT
jgi:hydrogenase nickel incorporation protein HypA/HybF